MKYTKHSMEEKYLDFIKTTFNKDHIKSIDYKDGLPVVKLNQEGIKYMQNERGFLKKNENTFSIRDYRRMYNSVKQRYDKRRDYYVKQEYKYQMKHDAAKAMIENIDKYKINVSDEFNSIKGTRNKMNWLRRHYDTNSFTAAYLMDNESVEGTAIMISELWGSP